ncbi:UNVERIFIED_ORG: hypothetical protein ABIC58_000273 [Leuconostoc holzapfelii]
MANNNYPSGMTVTDLQHVGELPMRYETRLEYLRNERSKSLDEIDQVNDYIHELDDEIRQLEFGDE